MGDGARAQPCGDGRHSTGQCAAVGLVLAWMVGVPAQAFPLHVAELPAATSPSSQAPSPAGKDALATVQEAINLAVTLQASGAYAQAAQLWQTILTLLEVALGQDHVITVQARANLAQVFIRLGRYQEAEPLLRRALASLEKAKGPDHPDVAIALNNLASLYEDLGRYPKAEALYLRSLAIRRKASGTRHSSTANAIDNLAGLYKRQGRYTEAETLLKQALEIRESLDGAEQRDIATSLNNLAVFYESQGRFADAERLQRRAVAIRHKVLGPEHPDTITSLSNLASLHDSLGRSAEAEPLYRQVLSARERSLGPDHLSTAQSLNNLAAILTRLGRPAEAETLYERAQKIQEKVLGPEHDARASTLSNWAGALQQQGRIRDAEARYRQALAVREKALGRDHPDLAITLNNLATNQALQGRDAEALALYRRALAIGEASLGPTHPSTALQLDNLAGLLLVQGRTAEARPLLERLNRSQSVWLRRELPLQPRELRMAQLAAQPDALASTFALLDQDSGAAALALELRLNRQGLLAEIERLQRLLAAGTPQARRQAEQLGAIDRQLAALSLPPDRRRELREQQQSLELALYQSLPALQLRAITTAEVATALKAAAPKGLLVEFQKYRPYRRTAQGLGQWGAPRYLALLLRPDGSIRSVPLGDAAGLEGAIAQALAASSDPTRQQEAPGLLARVSQLLLSPLSGELAGVQELFLSPDGELNRLPFAALPVAEPDGRTLADAFQLRILTTGRDLVRLQQPARASGPAVLIANPDFNARGRSASGQQTGSGQQRSASVRGLIPWMPLAGTAEEARLLAPLLRLNSVISGEQASAARVLQQKSPHILHIATHGFFLPDQEPRSPRDGSPVIQEDPLQRSGLVFAGANHPEANPADDGYLTAAEATGMDLSGAELVTLSACETGLGGVRSGEGVYGLQRSLAVAGARASLLSLWKVDDELTALFMQHFYRRLNGGQSRADALRDTQAAFRTNKLSILQPVQAEPAGRRGALAAVPTRASAAVPSSARHTTVYVWGAFQLSGDWRALSAR
jgi:CHAT domain-containing protein/Flp pilus assembly protein TadD